MIVPFLFVNCGGGNDSQSSAYTISFYDENLDLIETASITALPNGAWYKAGETAEATNDVLNDNIRLYAVPDVIEITTQEQLAAINTDNITLAGKYILLNDIELDETKAGFEADKGWKPIGSYSSYFAGIFNANFHKITNLWIDRPDEDGIGFFGYVEGGNIRNLGIEIANDKEIRGYSDVGGIAGYVVTIGYGDDCISVAIINSYVVGNVSGFELIGGIAGVISGDWMSDSEENYVFQAFITNSYFIGNVSGNGAVGGIVGWNNGDIANTYSIGNISGDEHVGGIAGVTYGGSVTNSYSLANVSGDEAVGGIMGTAYLASMIKNSAAINPTIAGNDYVNRVAGGVAGGRLISNNFAFDDMDITPVGYYVNEELTYEVYNGIDKTITQLQTLETYSDTIENGGLGWKFGNDNDNPWKWDINKNNGFPYLYWQEL